MKTGFTDQTTCKILWLSTEGTEMNLTTSVCYKQKCSHHEDSATD